MRTIQFDLPKLLFGVLFLLMLIVASFWVVQPFILSMLWAGMVVIATWPLMLKIQKFFFNKRSVAVFIISTILLLFFIIPIAALVNSMVEKSGPFFQWITNPEHWQFPDFVWLNQIPFVGDKIYSFWHQLIADGGHTLLTKVQPFVGKTSSWFISKAANVGFFLVHCGLMWLFSVIFYSKGEMIAHSIRAVARRIAEERGDATVILAAQAVRAVALGVVVTALLQSILGGFGLAFAGIPYAPLLTIVMFLLCIAQLGPLFVLIPAVIYLFWHDATLWGSLLLIWSIILGILDSVLRPLLIKMGIDLPLFLILGGVIGGLLAFGMVGLFIGPVVLAVSHRLLLAWMNEVDYKSIK